LSVNFLVNHNIFVSVLISPSAIILFEIDQTRRNRLLGTGLGILVLRV